MIARAAEVLRALRDDTGGMSLGRIAERVGLPRPTVQRIVGAFPEERLVIASGAGGSIRLGPEISALAGGADSGGTDRPASAWRFGILSQPNVTECFGPP